AILERLNENAARVGLKINIATNNLMRIGASNLTPLTINDYIIEDVGNFPLLGSKRTKDGGSEADIRLFRIFNRSLKSVLLYGCTTWSLHERLHLKSAAYDKYFEFSGQTVFQLKN
uniref:Uncharacterized protein n=1 Tax=Stomoxys calcitrans TaxID=35570 RepID=A0A1I8Q3T6_STOCA